MSPTATEWKTKIKERCFVNSSAREPKRRCNIAMLRKAKSRRRWPQCSAVVLAARVLMSHANRVHNVVALQKLKGILENNFSGVASEYVIQHQHACALLSARDALAYFIAFRLPTLNFWPFGRTMIVHWFISQVICIYIQLGPHTRCHCALWYSWYCIMVYEISTAHGSLVRIWSFRVSPFTRWLHSSAALLAKSRI